MKKESIYLSIPGKCRRGLHDKTPENTYTLPSKGWKICRKCRSENFKKDRKKFSKKRNEKVYY